MALLYLTLFATGISAEVVVPVTTDHLCRGWLDASNSGISTTGLKCEQPACKSGTFASSNAETTWTAEIINFAKDGTYFRHKQLGTGQSSCDFGGGTFATEMITYGDYTLEGQNPDHPDFTRVTYTPKWWEVTLKKVNAGLIVAEDNTCVPNNRDYLNDPAVGCLCNGTWEAGVPRVIALLETNKTLERNATTCPANTCHSTFLFNNATVYGNMLMSNTSRTVQKVVNNQTADVVEWFFLLDLTEPRASNTTGYLDNTTVYALSEKDGEGCRATVESTTDFPTMAPTTAPSAPATSAVARASVGLAVWLGVVLSFLA